MNKQEAKERTTRAETALREILKSGDTVYTVLRHVSASGMQRRIDCYAIGTDRRPHYLSGYMEAVGLGRLHKTKQGLVVNGCGMDMGYHLVNNLSMHLFCKGTYTHKGAYALKHEWI